MHRTPDITDALRAVRALSHLHGSHSTMGEECVIAAVQAGRAAYWTTASYHNQAAMAVLELANRCDLTSALALFAVDHHPSYAARRDYLLGTLIPLNGKARQDINRAWEAMGEATDAMRRARAARPAPMFEVA